jgi:hypothetical protein
MVATRRATSIKVNSLRNVPIGIATDASLENTPIRVAVRIRPLTEQEFNQPLGGEYILKAMDQHVVAFDPPPETIKPVSGSKISAKSSGRRHKDLKYAFDVVLDETATQQEVYEVSTKGLVDNVFDGFNATVFAYGVSFPCRISRRRRIHLNILYFLYNRQQEREKHILCWALREILELWLVLWMNYFVKLRIIEIEK